MSNRLNVRMFECLNVRTLGFFGCLIGALLCFGCISSRGGVERTTTLWTVGKTTRRDVVKAWGTPDVVADDVWVWRNRTTAGGQLKASFMMIGATVRNLAYSTYEHRLTFRPDGTLADEEVVNYAPGHDEWSINPWD